MISSHSCRMLHQRNINHKKTLSRFFSTFDMYKLGKIRQHHWKDGLKISKTVKFESDTSLASEDRVPQSCKT